MTGLNYRVIDPSYAKQGIEKIIWNGMWRDKSPDAAATLLDNNNSVSRKVVEYIALINIYFASTNVDTQQRKHIEGCIAGHLGNKHPELTRFYPIDNHVGTKGQATGEKVLLLLDEEIAGIDKELMI